MPSKDERKRPSNYISKGNNFEMVHGSWFISMQWQLTLIFISRSISTIFRWMMHRRQWFSYDPSWICEQYSRKSRTEMWVQQECMILGDGWCVDESMQWHRCSIQRHLLNNLVNRCKIAQHWIKVFLCQFYHWFVFGPVSFCNMS